MNRKYLNIALMVLLVVVWSGVIYKFFGGKNTNVPNPNISLVSGHSSDFTFTKDTFQLEFLNSDPFRISKSRSHPSPTKVTQSKPRPITKPKTKKDITWPEISYHGFVKANGNDTKLVVMKIGTKLFRARENETVNDIKLEKAFNDSIVIAFNKEKKTIKRQ